MLIFLLMVFHYYLVDQLKLKKKIFAVGIQTSFYNRSLNYDELIFNEDEFLDFRNFSFIDFSFGFSVPIWQKNLLHFFRESNCF